MADYSIIAKGRLGERRLLLGNEAVVRGALEASFSVFTTYPGTPASEILDVTIRVAHSAGVYAEYSVNEKVAIDTAAGAAMNGSRSLTAMKHVGLNVAADTFMVLPYFAPKSALVVVVADDPSAYSSQNEQDSRNYAYFANLPTLQPSDPQEVKDCMIRAASVSEKFELPVFLRMDLRVSHVRGPVVFGEIPASPPSRPFLKEKGRYTAIPPYPLKAHADLLEKMEKCKTISNSDDFTKLFDNGSENGVICAGSAATYVLDADIPTPFKPDVLKMLMINPLPEERIIKFLSEHKKVLVVEELDPIFETKVKSIAYDNGLNAVIMGKGAGIPSLGELTLGDVSNAIATLAGVPKANRPARTVSSVIPRPPVFCAGCPHRSSMYIIKTVAGKERVVVSDIGCYGVGTLPPTEVGDILLDMGFSVGGAGGISILSKQKPVAVVGDSTFLHAGIPALINAVWNGHRMLLVILDNSITAMTGLQPNPGSGPNPGLEGSQGISIESIVKACGVADVQAVDPFELKVAKEAFRGALARDGVSVVIFKAPCALLATRQAKAAGIRLVPYMVVYERCNNCNACLTLASCPALLPAQPGATGPEGKVNIDSEACTGCGFCAEVCPYDAIVQEETPL